MTPRDDLKDTLEALAAERGLTCDTQHWRRGYAVLAVARRSAVAAFGAASSAKRP